MPAVASVHDGPARSGAGDIAHTFVEDRVGVSLCLRGPLQLEHGAARGSVGWVAHHATERTDERVRHGVACGGVGRVVEHAAGPGKALRVWLPTAAPE